MDSIGLMILLQVVLIALNAFFACAEIAVISMNDAKLAHMAAEGDKRAMRLARLTSEPARFLATIQVAITLSGFLGSAFAAENFSGVLVDWVVSLGVTNISVEVLDSIAVILITILLSFFTLVFGELVPKQVAMRKAESLALGMSGTISIIATLFKPLVSLLTASTNGVLRLLGIDPNAKDDEVSEEEIRMMVDVGSEKGTIDDAEREFIQNVFEFDDISAGELVTHRTEVIMLDIADDMETWKEIIHNSRHASFPIFEENADNIIGVLKAKEYFRLEDQSRDSVMKHAVRDPYFVPATIKADRLFRNMKKGRRTMAVVLDEYGGMMGVITVKDLIEQLVGDYYAYDDTEEDANIKSIGENTWKIHGSALLEDVSEKLGVTLYCEDFDTFNGLIFHTLGKVPADGDKFTVEIKNLTVKVVKVQNHMVEVAIVTKKEEKQEAAKAEE